MPNITNKSHPEGFTVCDNRGLRHPDISFKATGLWAYVKSQPPDWEICIEHLAHQKRDGRDAIYSALEELIEVGLVMKRRNRVNGRFAGISYDFYDYPQTNGRKPLSPFTAKPDTAKPDTEKPDTENPPLINTANPINTNCLLSTNSSKQDESFEQWLEKRIAQRTDVRSPTKLIRYILDQGESSPEWQEWRREAQKDLSLYESLYEELTHV